MSKEPGHHQRPESWSGAAVDYEALFAPFSRGAAAAALERMMLRPGERFLDVAAGTGAVTIQAAEAGANVVAVDFAPGMLELLRARLVQRGLDAVETRVMDGQALDFAAESFDAAGSNLGLIFFADVARGLAELHRVLRPGGRAFVTSLARTERGSPLTNLIGRAIHESGPELSMPDSAPTLRLTAVDEIVTALAEAGFVEPRADIESVPFPVADPDEFWRRWVLHAPPTAASMAQLPPERLEASRLRFIELFEESVRQGDALFDTEVLIGLGRRS